MLTQLSTVKTRLGIAPADLTQDAMLTLVIQAVSARFDRQTNRTLARTVDATHEFPADDLNVSVPCYPIETISKFETKASETAGWIVYSGADPLVRRACIITLPVPLGPAAYTARVTYTGGFVLPGSVPAAGQVPLPKDLEHAATEQVAVWHQNRDKLGLIRHWPNTGTYTVLSQLPLLPLVTSTLRKYERLAL